MTDPLLRALEREVSYLRHIREGVLEILGDDRLTTEAKLVAIERLFEAEHDEDEEAEERRDRERLS